MSAKWTSEELILACETSVSKAEVLRKLGLVARGGNYRTISRHIENLEIDISHFTGQASNAGKCFGPKRPLDSYLVVGYTNSHTLKLRLLKEQIFEYRCSRCKNTEWQGVPIPLELDHIDGHHENNLIENLRLLCPNCHALTDTYRGKNQARVVQSAGDGSLKRNTVGVQIASRVPKVCAETSCTAEIHRNAIVCRKHVVKVTKIEWPSTEWLIEKLRSTPYTTLAVELGVSDKAIRKHLQVRNVEVPKGYPNTDKRKQGTINDVSYIAFA